VNLNRKTVAWIITAAITLMTINVTYTGIAAGVSLIPGASFLLGPSSPSPAPPRRRSATIYAKTTTR